MAGANHQWGYLTTAPFNGLWCRVCGCAQAGKNGLQDCPGNHVSGKTIEGWTDDPIEADVAKQKFVDAHVSKPSAQLDTGRISGSRKEITDFLSK